MSNPTTSGGRRLNKTPFFILAAAAAIVLVFLGLEIHKRGQRAQFEAKGPEIVSASADARRLTEGIGNGYVTPTPPIAEIHEPAPAPEPVVEVEDATHKRLIQARQKAYLEALESSTSIRIDEQRQRRDQAKPGATGLAAMIAQTAQAGTYVPPSAGISAGGINGLDNLDPNGQMQKNSYLDTALAKPGYLHESIQKPISEFELKTGTVIPATMVGGINSDLPGNILGQVSQNVYDTRHGQFLLIPQGTKVVGVYDSHIAYGQERVLVKWTRLVFPNGNTLDLDAMAGTDSAGYAGFNDKVNHHYGRLFGSALLLSVITAGTQYAVDKADIQNSSAADFANELSRSLGQNADTITRQITRKNLQIQPTLEIRPGYLFNIFVNKDVVLEPYPGDAA